MDVTVLFGCDFFFSCKCVSVYNGGGNGECTQCVIHGEDGYGVRRVVKIHYNAI